MDQFPSLDRWFDIHVNVPNLHGYTRYDLSVKNDLVAQEWDEFLDELALVIARLRLRRNWYKQWLEYWKNSIPIPPEWKVKFREQFWRGFVSSKATKEMGSIQFDETALQGYVGELILYLVQSQFYDQRIDAVPRKPKQHSKDSGIDCLELCGDQDDYDSLHYIAWECKGTTDDTPDNFPGKIYRGHLEETCKSFGEMIGLLFDLHSSDDVLKKFIDEMIDDFYSPTPSLRKRFGGCVTYSASCIMHSGAFSRFASRFKGKLAEDAMCRQIRLCAVGDFAKIIKHVRDRIWIKLLP
jgi:hypothetical protein